MGKVLIIAYKNGTEFYPDRIVDNIELAMSRLEYGDVVEGNFQVWEYPTGRIFTVEPDRQLTEKDYYVVPLNEDGIKWLPKMREIMEDKNLVTKAFKRLSEST